MIVIISTLTVFRTKIPCTKLEIMWFNFFHLRKMRPREANVPDHGHIVILFRIETKPDQHFSTFQTAPHLHDLSFSFHMEEC